MRVEEAKYIGQILKDLSQIIHGPVLNLGSSTEHFRKVDQSHIHQEIFEQLDRTEVQVLHSDLKQQEGVDISGDIFDLEVQNRLKDLKPQVILVCNLMEHLQVEVREILPRVLDNILDKNGYLIITVPYRYPLHFDPIDTYYRPTPQELGFLFSPYEYEVVDSKVVVSTTFLPELLNLGWRDKFKVMVRLLTPFYRFRKWLGLVHRFTFLFRPYKVSCIVLKKVK